MTTNAEDHYYAALAHGLLPDARQSVSEWADAHRRLSGKAASEPGPWRTSRTPYLKEIMDCLSPSSPVERVVFMKGSQIGGTECGNNWIGFIIHHAPGPMLAVLPTVEMAKRNSKQRLDPLIEESPALRERVFPSRARDSGNTILAKEFQGGILVMTGANSAVGLRSMPVRYLFLDEIDAYPGDADGEGDPVALAEARTRTFSRRKILLVSTPTVRGCSRIEREFQNSDQRRYMVPCPHCGTHQWLKFEQLKWPEKQPEAVYYQCEHCEAVIDERHKTWMLENGYQRPSVSMSNQWKSAIAKDEKVAVDWWKQFNSAELNSLIDSALHDNNDVRAATDRIKQARATAKVTSAALFPSVDYTASASKTKTVVPDVPASNNTLENSGLNISYELDLFGKNRASAEAARSDVAASVFDHDALVLTLTSEVAKNYFNILNLKEQLAIAQDNLKITESVMTIINARYKAGAVSGLETAQQGEIVHQARADVATLFQQEVQAENSLAVLEGQSPQDFKIAENSLQILQLPTISPAQPSALLSRRPDIRAAEERLIAANANIAFAFKSGHSVCNDIDIYAGFSDSENAFKCIECT